MCAAAVDQFCPRRRRNASLEIDFRSSTFLSRSLCSLVELAPGQAKTLRDHFYGILDQRLAMQNRNTVLLVSVHVAVVLFCAVVPLLVVAHSISANYQNVQAGGLAMSKGQAKIDDSEMPPFRSFHIHILYVHGEVCKSRRRWHFGSSCSLTSTSPM